MPANTEIPIQGWLLNHYLKGLSNNGHKTFFLAFSSLPFVSFFVVQDTKSRACGLPGKCLTTELPPLGPAAFELLKVGGRWFLQVSNLETKLKASSLAFAHVVLVSKFCPQSLPSFNVLLLSQYFSVLELTLKKKELQYSNSKWGVKLGKPECITSSREICILIKTSPSSITGIHRGGELLRHILVSKDIFSIPRAKEVSASVSLPTAREWLHY